MTNIVISFVFVKKKNCSNKWATVRVPGMSPLFTSVIGSKFIQRYVFTPIFVFQRSDKNHFVSI